MLREKAETFIIAASICLVSIVVLLTGMWLTAMKNNSKNPAEQAGKDSDTSWDVIGNVIEGVPVASLQEEFPKAQILTWDEYYDLSGQPVEEEYQRGIYGKQSEKCWSMEEAGLLILEEINKLEDIQKEDMYLMMAMANASSSQAIDVWRGYLCNFLAGETPLLRERKEFYVQVNAYTGEIIYIEKHTKSGESYVLLDSTNKVESVVDNSGINYETVPMITFEEYWPLSNQNFGVSSDYYKYGAEGYISMKEAGILVLKEIHRLFGEDMTGMKLIMSFGDGQWGGWLLNEYDTTSKEYRNYSFRVDARTGKIWSITGGERNVTYTKKSAVSDVEIIQNTRQIIQKYHLANVKNVNWSTVLVYNASADIEKLIEKSKEQSGVHINNYVEFYTDEGELVRVSTDWETGELWMVLYKDYQYMYK